MSDEAGKERVSDIGTDLGNVTENMNVAKGFVRLVLTLEKLSGIQDRVYEKERNHYSAVSAGRPISELELLLEEFFGSPKKRSDNPVPNKLRNHPILGHLEGDLDRQSLFFKKSENGIFFGALMPLAEPYGAVAIRLGFARKRSPQKSDNGPRLEMEGAAPAQTPGPDTEPSFSEEDPLGLGMEESGADAEPGLEMEGPGSDEVSGPEMKDGGATRAPELGVEDIGIPARSKEERMAEELAVGTGMINGVGLAAFLLEAEIEQSSCTIRVVSGRREGRLYVRNGILVDAAADGLQGQEAAEAVISWTDTELFIEDPVDKEENTVEQTLPRTLAAALKKRKTGRSPAAGGRPPAPSKTPARKKGKKEKSKAAAGGKTKKKTKAKRKQRIRPLHLAAVVLVLILAAGAVFGYKFWKEGQREKALAEATAAAEAQADVEKAVSLLEDFVKAGPDDKYTRQAEERIRTLRTEAEKRFFDGLSAEVAALPMGPDFEKRAEQIYRRHLERYPEGQYAKKIDSLIASLPDQVEAHFYRQVKESENLEPAAKIDAYRQYLDHVPDGAHSSEVRRKMDALLADQLRYLEMEVRRCEIQGEALPCLQLIDNFADAYPAAAASNPTLSKWRRQLQLQQDRADLEKQTAGLDQQPERLRRVLEDFMAKRPDTPLAGEVKERLAALDRQAGAQRQWERVQAAARDQGRPIADRIETVRTYLSKARSETHRRAAMSLQSELEREYSRQMRQRREMESERMRQARLQQQQARLEQEQLRLSRLLRQVEGKLAAAGGRYISRGDGTFSDTRTGLMWTLLDSRRVLNRCHDYETARQYVSGLSTGNFRDWRLPTAAELAGIYKNSPYFPDGDVSWYWTSKSFVTGYHEKVRVVRPDGSGELQPEYRRSTECGAVRAVRNPR
jgi:type II secretory pathway pseudopilin PulG